MSIFCFFGTGVRSTGVLVSFLESGLACHLHVRMRGTFAVVCARVCAGLPLTCCRVVVYARSGLSLFYFRMSVLDAGTRGFDHRARLLKWCSRREGTIALKLVSRCEKPLQRVERRDWSARQNGGQGFQLRERGKY